MNRFLIACAALALLAGCASQPKVSSFAEAFEPQPDVSLTFEARTVTHQPPLASSMPFVTHTPGKDDRAFKVHIMAVQLDDATAFGLLGSASMAPTAASLDAETAAKVRQAAWRNQSPRHIARDATRNGPHSMDFSFVGWQGQRNTFASMDTISYISGFEITHEEQVDQQGRKSFAAIASATVDKAPVGTFMAISVSPVDPAMLELEMHVEFNEPLLPFPEATVKIGSSDVTFQTPVLFRQRLKVEGTIANGHVLALTGLPRRESGQWLILVELSQTDELPKAPQGR